MELELLKSIVLSIVLGFLIGLERNISFKEEHEKGFAGSRTFALISLLGFLSTTISSYYPYFIYFGFLAVLTLSAIAYFLKVYHYNKQGTTTHFSALLAFIVGVLVGKGEFFFAILITVVIILILNLKSKIQNVESKLSSSDINAAILLIAMSVLILPYLPDKMVYYINPYKTWLMAVIISSLSFLGYLAIKFFGEKHGILLTGAAGGFVSSTAVTYSLSKLYAKMKQLNTLYTYAAAIAIANTIMFARVFVEALIINKKLALLLALPYLLTTLIGIIISIRYFKKSPNNLKTPEIIEKNPLELDEALKFAVIFAVIYSLTYYIGNKYGNIGIYIVSFISGLTDVDAITLSLSSLAKNDIPLKTAAVAIAIATVSNTLFKLGVVYFSAPKKLFKLLLKFFLLLLSVFISLAFLLIPILRVSS